MARILITGGKGMLGRTLQRELADHELFVADLPETDMLDTDSLGARSPRSVRSWSSIARP